MKKKLWILPVLIGILLIGGAVGLVVYNMYESNAAFEKSQDVMTELKQLIPDPSPANAAASPSTEPPSDDLFAPYEEPTTQPPSEMRSISVNGEEYCGYITLPQLGLELPVMSGWSYERLKTSPCRYSGTVEGRDIIIAAHNYNSHFGRIKELSQGDEIWFTTADGMQYFYRVDYTENVDGYDVDQMLSGGSSDWDMTLFTCTLSGQSRVTVRASFEETEE
ncbi:sortase [Ruminococcus sp.]|uniref:sortase n=1 Tax=Ruminococcus sp. TaxID=41978 RepID=UPI002CBB15F3|nr:sortase [Ruminococcus sp.]HOA00390.1 sortase [Ruminococcus sp.]HOH88327.1 sortase [Ruminococcus sp.]